jgi:hypothetical protein
VTVQITVEVRLRRRAITGRTSRLMLLAVHRKRIDTASSTKKERLRANLRSRRPMPETTRFVSLPARRMAGLAALKSWVIFCQRPCQLGNSLCNCYQKFHLELSIGESPQETGSQTKELLGGMFQTCCRRNERTNHFMFRPRHESSGA